VRVRSSGTNRIVDVACESTSRQLAADFCNTLAQEYIDQNLEARWKSTEYTGQWLTKQLEDLKINLEKQEEQLQGYARATGLVFTDEKNDVQQANLVDLQKELSAAQADRIAKQSKYEMASSSPTTALPDLLDDATLKDSQKALADLQTKLAQLTVTFTPNHTEVRRVQAEITAIEATLERSRNNVLTRVRKEFEAAQRREALLLTAYTAQARLLSGKAEETAHYNLLKREVDATRPALRDAPPAAQGSEHRERAAREQHPRGRHGGNTYRALQAERPAAHHRGLLFGLILGVAFAVMRERADRTLQDPGDVTYYLGLPELGVVPVGDLLEPAKAKTALRSPTLALKSGDASKRGSFDTRVEMISFRQKQSAAGRIVSDDADVDSLFAQKTESVRGFSS
jgi:hypothetical protein